MNAAPDFREPGNFRLGLSPYYAYGHFPYANRHYRETLWKTGSANWVRNLEPSG